MSRSRLGGACQRSHGSKAGRSSPAGQPAPARGGDKPRLARPGGAGGSPGGAAQPGSRVRAAPSVRRRRRGHLSERRSRPRSAGWPHRPSPAGPAPESRARSASASLLARPPGPGRSAAALTRSPRPARATSPLRAPRQTKGPGAPAGPPDVRAGDGHKAASVPPGAPPAAEPRAGTRAGAELLTKAAARGVRTHRNMSTRYEDCGLTIQPVPRRRRRGRGGGGRRAAAAAAAASRAAGAPESVLQ